MGLFPDFPATKELKEAIIDVRATIRNVDGAVTDFRRMLAAFRAAIKAAAAALVASLDQ